MDQLCKMKWIYSLFFIIYGVYAEEVETVMPSPVQMFLQDRCYKNAKQGDAYDQLVGLTYDFSKYAQYTSTFIPVHLEHFCKDEKPILLLKMKDVNKNMLECMPKEEKFLPQFIQNTLTDLLQFLCVNGGTNVKTLFSTHGKECRASLSRHNATQEMGVCFARVFSSVSDKGLVSKDMICRDILFMKGCFFELLDKYCPDYKAFKELNKEFFRYIQKPCSACIFGISNVVTFLCVLVTLLHRNLF